MPRVIGRFVVPVLSQNRQNSVGKSIIQKFRNLGELIKPERYLGAPWMSNFVALRKCLPLCELCRLKYGRWYVKENYLPDRDIPWIAHCEGCGERDVRCTNFYPEENIGTVLESRFWKHSDQGKTIRI